MGNAQSEEVAPEMREAIRRAYALLAVESFIQDLDREVPLADGCALGLDRKTCTIAWFHRFCTLKERLVSSVVLPRRGNFLRILGRRVRALSLSDAHAFEGKSN